MVILKPIAYYEPEQIASSHLDHDLEEAFVQAGYETIVVTPSPTRGISSEIRRKYKNIRYEEKFNGKVKIIRVPVFKEGKKPISRAWRYVWSSVKIYIKCIKQKNISILFASSTPPTQGMLAALIAKKLHVPFIFILQDIFPDSLVNIKMTKRGSLIWKIGTKVENFTYKNANKIIVISESFKKNILDKGVSREKVEVICNWVDTNKVFPVERNNNPLFDIFHLDRELFYITYCGNIGHTQNLDMLLSVAKMCEIEPLVQFVFFGEGAYVEDFDRNIKTNQSKNVLRFPFQPYKDIANVFSLGDVGLIISKPDISQNSVPSKTWSIMAAARPVLASFDLESTLSNVITEANCGMIVPADDEDALYNAIKKLFNSRDSLSELGNNGREYIKTKLNKELCTKKYIGVIEEVIRI